MQIYCGHLEKYIEFKLFTPVYSKLQTIVCIRIYYARQIAIVFRLTEKVPEIF